MRVSLSEIGSAALALMGGFVGLPPRQGRQVTEVVLHERQSLPVLTRFPKVSSHRDLVLDLERSDGSEGMQIALATIFTEIVDPVQQRQPRFVLVSSVSPRQGKTFTAMALGRFAARAGHQVLVLECDLRKPVLETTFGLEPVAYLQDVLDRLVDPPMALLSTDVPGLEVIAAKAASVDPAKMLDGDGMAALLAWAGRYDLVILDGPSLGTQGDTRLLARWADGVLICARADEADSRAVAMATQQIFNCGVTVFGIIQTQATSMQPTREKTA